MIKSYKILNIDENTTITYDYVLTTLKNVDNDYELDCDLFITYRGIYDIEQLENDNIADVLINNDIRFTTKAQCDDCGCWYDENDLTYVHQRHDEGMYVCSDCIEDSDKYFYCDECGDWYDDTQIEHIYTHNDNIICEYCYNDYYSTCDDCGSVYNTDDMIWSDENDCYYCDYCYDNHSAEHMLYGYHEFHDWQPTHLPTEPTPPYYIGHELEIDYGDDMEDAINSIKSMANGICMHDGSLSSKGIEFISHPLSYKYMLSQETKYRELFDHLVNLGYKSHNTTDCGLHFHVTRPQNSKIIDRIILFMETYKEEIITLSRRKSDEINRWSRFLSDKRTSTNEKVIKSLDYIVKNKDTCDRYMALNLTNSKTIEFRFFKGTLKYETFMADFEFINNLVELASDLELPIEELTWTKVVSKGQFLPAYIEEHNLYSDRPIIDYSKELLVEFNNKKSELRIKTDNMIAELLKNIANKARTKNNTSQKLQKTYSQIYGWNEMLSSLQNVLYNLENIEPLDYYKLDNVGAYVKDLEGRMN